MKIASGLVSAVLPIALLCGCGAQTRNSDSHDIAKPVKQEMDGPPGVATPNLLDTRIGSLTSVDGVPDEKSSKLVFDNLDFQRATQAYLTTLQIPSMQAIRKGHLGVGFANSTVLTYGDLMDSKSLFLTANTSSVYMTSWVELTDEPLVIETPPNVLGLVNNSWFHHVVDFGLVGADRGRGGKFLLVPPGYKGELPAGYHIARTETYGNWVIWRGKQIKGSTQKAVADTKTYYRTYPLSKRDNPPKMNFVNMSGVPINTVQHMDYPYWEALNAVIQREPVNGISSEMRGQLAALGIVKGKPFKPDARMKKILREAADLGAVTVRALAARPRGEEFYIYPGQSNWMTPFVGGSHEFLNDGARLLDAKSYFHFYAIGVSPAMSRAPVGKGSQYGVAYLDSNGQVFDGAMTYKLTLPANIPANDFWAVTLYDNQTRTMLQTDQRFPGIDNLTGNPVPNADGSVDIYFGAKAPEGKEANWIQTIPGKGWNTIFRLYGPQQTWFDKTWRPGEIELLD